MKKISFLRAFILLIAASFASSADAQVTNAVYSVNIIGMQKIAVSSNLAIRSNPFQSALIGDVAGKSGRASSFSTIADNIQIFNATNQSYVTYFLGSNATLGAHWRLGSTPQTNFYLPPGVGYFYRSRSTTPWTNTIVGDVVLAPAITNIIRPGLNLLSYPYSVSRNLTNLNLKFGRASSFSTVADNLMIFNTSNQSYTTYFLGSNATLGVHWRLGGSAVTNLILEPGAGFFYRSRLTNIVNWIETSPYPEL